MAQVRGQHGKFRVEISAFLVPLDQSVNGKRVTNVMKTWTLAPSAMGDTTFPEQLPKGVIDRLTVVNA